jgi:hypothetical protein
MKVIIKNNRLQLENQMTNQMINLGSLAEADLAKIAAKYQIGTQRVARRSMDVTKHGKVEEEERLVYEKKPRIVLEDEIRSHLMITIDIPREYWTQEQAFAWESNNVQDMNDINDINRIKRGSGILTELPPFEDGLDNFNTSKLLCELTEEQWQFISDYYNFVINLEKDEVTGQKTQKRTYIHRLLVHEWVPENDQDIERLKDMKDTASVKLSKEKYVKKDKAK